MSVPTSIVRRSSGHGLVGIRGRIARIGDRHRQVHRSGPPRIRSAISCSRKSGPRFASSSGETATGCAAGKQRPSHRMLRAGIVGEDEAVEAVEPLFRVAAGPGRALGPVAELRELGMGADESRHRVRVLAARSEQELVERLRRRDGEERRIDHGACAIPARPESRC